MKSVVLLVALMSFLMQSCSLEYRIHRRSKSISGFDHEKAAKSIITYSAIEKQRVPKNVISVVKENEKFNISFDNRNDMIVEYILDTNYNVFKIGYRVILR